MTMLNAEVSFVTCCWFAGVALSMWGFIMAGQFWASSPSDCKVNHVNSQLTMLQPACCSNVGDQHCHGKLGMLQLCCIQGLDWEVSKSVHSLCMRGIISQW